MYQGKSRDLFPHPRRLRGLTDLPAPRGQVQAEQLDNPVSATQSSANTSISNCAFKIPYKRVDNVCNVVKSQIVDNRRLFKIPLCNSDITHSYLTTFCILFISENNSDLSKFRCFIVAPFNNTDSVSLLMCCSCPQTIK